MSANNVEKNFQQFYAEKPPSLRYSGNDGYRNLSTSKSSCTMCESKSHTVDICPINKMMGKLRTDYMNRINNLESRIRQLENQESNNPNVGETELDWVNRTQNSFNFVLDKNL